MCPCDELYKLPDLSFIGGGTKTIKLNIFTSKGQPTDAASVSGKMTIVSASQRNSSSRLTVDLVKKEGELNVFTATLAPDDTKDLYGKYIYQISLTVDGVAEEPRQGNLYIGYNIDRT